MVNNTTVINATTDVAASTDIGTAVQVLISAVLLPILHRYFLFFATPFTHPEMWWLLIHLILTFVLFEFYFERHHDEDLGWTAALANSIVMFFISMELLRVIYGHKDSPFTVLGQIIRDYFSVGIFSEQMILVSLILILGLAGIATAIINYYHLLPKRLAFMISGHKTVNLLAYFLMVVVFRQVHGHEMPLDGLTLVALILFGITMWIVVMFLAKTRRKRREQKKLKKGFTPFQ